MYVQPSGLRPSSTNHWMYSSHGIRAPRMGLAPKHRRTSQKRCTNLSSAEITLITLQLPGLAR
ncbi:hypothetical protein GB937_010226 [Aspergillus fischeri]|nr:hypothetical protein GB937_010226 [Aspergillus fischeri]